MSLCQHQVFFNDIVSLVCEPCIHLYTCLVSYCLVGNHDYYGASIDKLMDLWKSLGLIVLHNSNVKIENKEKDFFNLVGIDDIEGKFLRYLLLSSTFLVLYSFLPKIHKFLCVSK